MDYGAAGTEFQIDAAYANMLTTFAATAWYHHALADRPAELQPFLREAEAFVQDVYAPLLFKGRNASTAERQKGLDGLARFTGISAAYWDQANLRMDEAHFLQELMRKTGEVGGRIDTRYKGGNVNPLSETMMYAPFGAAISPALLATFNDYYRQELKLDAERAYVLTADLWKDWDFRHEQPGTGFKGALPSTAVDLAVAMAMNPKMKVQIHSGYFDLACPYGMVNYVFDHMSLTPALRANIGIENYEAGHMMYVHGESIKKFKRSVAAFLDENSR